MAISKKPGKVTKIVQNKSEKNSAKNITIDDIETIIHPNHYSSFNIEPLIIIRIIDTSFELGCVIKYLSRAGIKTNDPSNDLLKAAFFMKAEAHRIETIHYKFGLILSRFMCNIPYISNLLTKIISIHRVRSFRLNFIMNMKNAADEFAKGSALKKINPIVIISTFLGERKDKIDIMSYMCLSNIISYIINGVSLADQIILINSLSLSIERSVIDPEYRERFISSFNLLQT